MRWIIFIFFTVLFIYFGFVLTTRYIFIHSCGGIAGEEGAAACPQLFFCSYTDHYPDATGTCRFQWDVLP
jgi:hypothetical protein